MTARRTLRRRTTRRSCLSSAGTDNKVVLEPLRRGWRRVSGHGRVCGRDQRRGRGDLSPSTSYAGSNGTPGALAMTSPSTSASPVGACDGDGTDDVDVAHRRGGDTKAGRSSSRTMARGRRLHLGRPDPVVLDETIGRVRATATRRIGHRRGQYLIRSPAPTAPIGAATVTGLVSTAASAVGSDDEGATTVVTLKDQRRGGATDLPTTGQQGDLREYRRRQREYRLLAGTDADGDGSLKHVAFAVAIDDAGECDCRPSPSPWSMGRRARATTSFSTWAAPCRRL